MILARPFPSKRVPWIGLAAGLLLALPAAGSPPPDWPQWGRNPQHTGASPVLGQPLESILADIVYDPFVGAETAESGGSLLVHYAVPLTEGGDVYMTFKSGAYVSCVPPESGLPFPCGRDSWGTQIWNVKKLRWEDGALAEVWTFESDWKPEPAALAVWEPVFLPVLAGGFLYVPGLGGTVHKLDKATGAPLARINPFTDLDPARYVAGGLGAGADGSVFYNALALDPANPLANARGGWLVRVAPDDATASVDFATLVPGAPAASDLCEGSFSNDVLPWPPTPTAAPPLFPCGSQRPGLNVVPAVAPDGTIYTVSRAHSNQRYGYLVAVRPDLTPAWAASFRDVLNDGCEVLLPPNGTPGGCRSGAARGVDPATNNRPAGRVSDLGTSSPVVLPDGAILQGTITRYNFSRGHLFKFSANGNVLATWDFGWDITPAVFPHGDTYSIVLKNNRYDTGTYCGDPDFCPVVPSRYDITSLSPDLVPEWSYTNTETQACVRQPNGSLVCTPHDETGFEWCVNQPAVDSAGVTYANAEDGYLYGIGPSGAIRERIFLNFALGAAYTPLSIGADGVIYSQNYGRLFAVGKARSPREAPERPGPRSGSPRIVTRP